MLCGIFKGYVNWVMVIVCFLDNFDFIFLLFCDKSIVVWMFICEEGNYGYVCCRLMGYVYFV